MNKLISIVLALIVLVCGLSFSFGEENRGFFGF